MGGCDELICCRYADFSCCTGHERTRPQIYGEGAGGNSSGESPATADVAGVWNAGGTCRSLSAITPQNGGVHRWPDHGELSELFHHDRRAERVVPQRMGDVGRRFRIGSGTLSDSAARAVRGHAEPELRRHVRGCLLPREELIRIAEKNSTPINKSRDGG